MNKNELFRRIPKVDIVLEEKEIKDLIRSFGRESVTDGIRHQLDEVRRELQAVGTDKEGEKLLAMSNLTAGICAYVEGLFCPNMKRVVNGTGMILFTNLGRAPIAETHAERLLELMTSYNNLEYDLQAGKRGERYAHFEELLCRITGAEAAMAVNNNAAAVMLILNSLAKGGEALVSRGELIEIGGKFRIPDVMKQSGVELVEVGTTNKTHLPDYEEALTEETKAILKVHTSNYRIVGFTESVSAQELKALIAETVVESGCEIPIVEDLGSGVLIDLEKYGLSHEPTVQEAIANGVDVVCFSGDKLLGGPQAGIIVGKKKYIDKMKKNQLTRALRIDKFTAAALEMVLIEYLNEEQAVRQIPVLRMISESAETLAGRAQSLLDRLSKADLPIALDMESCESQVGGGSLPTETLASVAVTLRPEQISVSAFAEKLRCCSAPVIGRVINDRIYLDMRTVMESDYDIILKACEEVL